MEVLSNIGLGLETALAPTNLLFVLIGVMIGMIIGVLPGLGPAATMALLLPFTLDLEPSTAIIMLAGVYYGSMYGGTITSVMLRVPGESASVVTTLDGYPMAQQGRGGAALGIAAIGSLIGGLVAVVGIASLAPQMARFALSFGPPALAALALMGLVLVSFVGSKSMVTGFAMACVGLLLATIGTDQFDGSNRATFGLIDLRSGVDIVVLTVGLLGMPALIGQLAQRRAASKEDMATLRGGKALPSSPEIKQCAGPIARGSVIGFLLGLAPGGGGIMSSLASYAVERRRAKDPKRFGNGAIEGVAGPETANNAAAQSGFVPLLTLGLPSNPVLAIVFGALLVHGITPGPSLVSNHADLFWGVVASMLVGNVVLVLVNIYMIRFWVRMVLVPISYLAPIAFAVVLVSAYSISYSLFEVGLLIAFGVVGYVLEKCGLDCAPLVLGFVLGAILEQNVRRSLLLGDGTLSAFFSDGIAVAVLGLTAAVVVLGVVGSFRRSRKSAVDAVLSHSETTTPDNSGSR